MIELTVGGKKFRFNLKSIDREKALFYAWFSMSDMPSKRNTKLRITTDKDEHLEYEIHEIQDCAYVDRICSENDSTREDAVVERLDASFNAAEASEIKTHPENSDVENKSIEEIYESYFPSQSDIAEEVKKIFCKLFEGLPKKQMNKILDFISRIRTLGYVADNTDPEISKIIMDMFRGPDDEDVTPYVDRFVEHMRKRKFC